MHKPHLHITIRRRRQLYILFVLILLAIFFVYYEFPFSYKNSDRDFLKKVSWLQKNHQGCQLTPSDKKITLGENQALLTLWDQNIKGELYTIKPMKRIRHLIDATQNIQLVIMQELFGAQAKRFPSHKHHPYFDYPGKNKMILRYTGLGLLSKLFIFHRHYELFSKGALWDKLAKKGVVVFRVVHPQLGLIDIYTTHLQAAYPYWSFNKVRTTQVEELINYIEKSNLGNLIIFTGDLNMTESDLLYQKIVSELGVMDVMRELYPDKEKNPLFTFPKSKKRLDYIFVKDSPKWKWNKEKSIGAVLDLGVSDHLGLCAALVFEKQL